MLRDLGKDRGRDRKLAARMAKGDAAAFAELVDSYGPRIQALARRYTATHADAEDLTQEIFIDLFRSIRSFRGDSSLATWACGVALNHCRKHFARRRPETYPIDEQVEDNRASPADGAEIREIKGAVRDALAGLSPEQCDVVVLHELQEMTYGECAAVLGIPVGTVKSRLYYAFRTLRTGSLGDYIAGDPPVPDSSHCRSASSAVETIP